MVHLQLIKIGVAVRILPSHDRYSSLVRRWVSMKGAASLSYPDTLILGHIASNQLLEEQTNLLSQTQGFSPLRSSCSAQTLNTLNIHETHQLALNSRAFYLASKQWVSFNPDKIQYNSINERKVWLIELMIRPLKSATKAYSNNFCSKFEPSQDPISTIYSFPLYGISNIPHPRVLRFSNSNG